MTEFNLDDDFIFFKENMESLYKRYGHKFLAIRDKKILGGYDSFEDALQETLKTEKIGTFLVQECLEEKEDAVNYFQNFNFAPIK
ncbi:MAG: hypothetical protein LBM19_00660 [Holosporales bacterium]|jgi:hypothetical protein|nr:hypothetical protein [Holosporales bacterium]